LTHPTFSLVVETANLSMADLDGLRQALESLSAQSLPLQHAAEVFLVDSGDVPEDVLQQMLSAFRWVRAKRLPRGTGYEELKMAGANAATGEVVVFADGDCFYERGWLAAILAPFSNPSVSIVGGDTAIDSRSAYGLGVAIAFSFAARGYPPDLHVTNRYHMNNVAFRRSVLQSVPIPSRRPCYRMTGLHVAALEAAGHTIWRQPAARSRHAPPNGFFHFMWRFLLFGHDGVAVPRLIAAEARSLGRARNQHRTTLQLFKRWTVQSTVKVIEHFRRQPSRILSLPIVAPVVAAAVIFQAAGAVAGLLAPKRLLEAMPDDLLRASTCQPGSALSPSAAQKQPGRTL
jgi:glycosyltransferase involved in cell wall biosynthesis